jgi:hypothetical protein
MYLYLHPTRHEALTLAPTVRDISMLLTRWSLATTPATPLLQRCAYYSERANMSSGQPFFYPEGLSEPLDDGIFAFVHVDPRDYLNEPNL